MSAQPPTAAESDDRLRPPLTDLAPFWAVLFCTAAIVLLEVIYPKYVIRQAALEQRFLARREIARRARAGLPPPAAEASPALVGETGPAGELAPVAELDPVGEIDDASELPAGPPPLLVPMWALRSGLLLAWSVSCGLLAYRRLRPPAGQSARAAPSAIP